MLLDPAGTAGDSTAQAMAASLRHRGPDGEGWHRVGPALLVHTRLAIIDVAGGDQPLYSEDGTITLVANGEIYNHRELRAELEARGHRFATGSDCEVIVHLYEEEGEDCVKRLNGIFGFSLWDARRNRLVAARDPFGVKPVYWAAKGRQLAVASEVGAVLAAGLGSTLIDPVALDHFLAWRFVPAPRTLFAGVSKLPAASVLVAEPDGPVRVTSYREAPGAPFADVPAAELVDAFADRFSEAVGRQMMSDVPYGTFLSGGIDSAGIAAAMARHDGKAPKSFTIGFPGYGDALDERAAAEHSARVIGTDHHSVAMSPTDFRTQLRECITRLEEPCGIPSAPALLQLSEFTAQSVKVVLSGQGADEPLGGYARHQAAALLRLAAAAGPLAKPVRTLAEALPRNERAKRAARLLGGNDATDRLLRIFEIAPPELRASLTGSAGEEAAAERRSLAEGVLADVADRDPLEQGLYLDTHLFLPDGLLVYGDKMTMAHGLEQRVPFLDVELMRFVERIPAQLRVRGLKRKWLHKQAMAKLIPDELINRPKLGFSTPYDQWLRESLGAELERRFVPGSDLGALIDPTTVGGLVSDHRSGRADHKRLLYCLLELAEWSELFGETGAGRLEAVAAA
ncbi:asparagine synthase (glutamine-hydrolyzing) [Solirubrobacter taibaiensis]|nr:asparagine synthase (glutamine-hydrolyzing) [Solirubrobacter taibaiensis]